MYVHINVYIYTYTPTPIHICFLHQADLAKGSNIVLGFVALVYFGPFSSVSILSAIRRKIEDKTGKKRERGWIFRDSGRLSTGRSPSTALENEISRQRERVGRRRERAGERERDRWCASLAPDCKSMFRRECSVHRMLRATRARLSTWCVRTWKINVLVSLSRRRFQTYVRRSLCKELPHVLLRTGGVREGREKERRA